MFDPSAGGAPPTRQELNRIEDYNRWLAFALAPREVELTAAERAAMFAPDRFIWGSRTHQLLAIMMYRDRVDGSPGVQQLIDHLCDGIAREARWDVRVTDLYMQRLAFILAAGRPDLVRRRWVERVIACQKPSGGWVANWCGLGPRILQLRLRPMSPNSHTTIQALWLLSMLKYRYPVWIDEHCAPERHASSPQPSEVEPHRVSLNARLTARNASAWLPEAPEGDAIGKEPHSEASRPESRRLALAQTSRGR